MRILSVHNRYLIRGGEDVCVENEEELLKRHGHQVSSYCTSNAQIASLGIFRAALNTVWSRESYLNIRQLLRLKTFDILSCHNTFPLISPAAYDAAKSEGLPVIQTLHNYRLVCPNATFFRNGKVCEECSGKFLPWPAVRHDCYRDSKAATTVVAIMLSVHRALRTYQDKVDVYIVPSEFAKQKFIENGLPADKLVVKPNFVYPDPDVAEGRGRYALFVGRLSHEKGLSTLLTAMGKLGKKLHLKIVGEGPLSHQLAKSIEKLSNVELLGPRSSKQVYELMGEAAFLVFPSEWYETFGRVAIEAFSKGTPVIGANIGAIPEVVEHLRTGLLFKPGDAEDLARQMEWAIRHPALLTEMRREARAEFESKYTSERNYEMLMRIYEMAAAGALS